MTKTAISVGNEISFTSPLLLGDVKHGDIYQALYLISNLSRGFVEKSDVRLKTRSMGISGPQNHGSTVPYFWPAFPGIFAHNLKAFFPHLPGEGC